MSNYYKTFKSKNKNYKLLKAFIFKINKNTIFIVYDFKLTNTNI
jgi:hypothetical protein